MHLITAAWLECPSRQDCASNSALGISLCVLGCYDANMNSEICVGQVAGTLTVKKSIIWALISCIDQGLLNSEASERQQR